MECDLSVLYGNITLTVCDTTKLRKHRVALSNLVDKHLPLSGKSSSWFNAGF